MQVKPTIQMVEEGCLAKRVLALSGRVAQVVTELSATQEVISIGLVRLDRTFISLQLLWQER